MSSNRALEPLPRNQPLLGHWGKRVHLVLTAHGCMWKCDSACHLRGRPMVAYAAARRGT